MDDISKLTPIDAPTANPITAVLQQDLQNPVETVAQLERRGLPVIRHQPFPPPAQSQSNALAHSVSQTVSEKTVSALPALDSNGRIDFTKSQGFTQKTLDNVNDGSARFARETVHSSLVPTTNPVTSTDAGASATVNIASFSTQVAGTTLTYNSGSVAGLSYSTLYYIYANDPTLFGGAVTYQTTTSKQTTLAATGNFFVGSVATANNGGADTTGNGDGGSASNQTGASNVISTATLTSGGWASVLNNRANFAISGVGTTNQQWQNFTVTFNYANAISRFFQCNYTLAMSSGTGSLTLRYYPDGSTPVNMVTVVTNTPAGVLTFSLPATIDIAKLIFEASASGVSGTPVGTATIANIRLVVNS